MKRVIIFGAGVLGSATLEYCRKTDSFDVVCFWDNNRNGKQLEGVLIEKPTLWREVSGRADLVMVAIVKDAYVKEIKTQLLELAVPLSAIKIIREDQELFVNVFAEYNPYMEQKDSRVCFLRNYAQYVYEQKIVGDVAECGVNRGDFAFYINKYFPDKRLYLFDTFEGFPEQDLIAERELKDKDFLEGPFNDTCFTSTSEEIVKKKMPHLEKVVIKKGYFPDTAGDIDRTFAFVMLDMDLYNPIFAGLSFFYDRMCSGSVILIHDYFDKSLPGVRKAVEDFEEKIGVKLNKLPIGDFCSIAVIC